MITEIPTPDDFKQQGIAFLNLAWHAVFNLIVQMEDSIDWKMHEEDISSQYWASASHSLVAALPLAFQGTELLIKGRICTVSPFLLLKGDWMKASPNSDTPFSRFQTVDANEIIRVHNIVATFRLPEAFEKQFHKLRQVRNTLTHGIDSRLRVQANEIIIAVLSAVDALIEPRAWCKLRRDWLSKEPRAVAFPGTEQYHRMAREIKIILGSLSKRELLKYFGYDKDRRHYICYDCARSSEVVDDLECRFATLEPNTPDSTNVHCFACGSDNAVVRERCAHCVGNVISNDWNVCLTCFQSQPDEGENL